MSEEEKRKLWDRYCRLDAYGRACLIDMAKIVLDRQIVQHNTEADLRNEYEGRNANRYTA